jgi:serine/threonine protein kinase
MWSEDHDPVEEFRAMFDPTWLRVFCLASRESYESIDRYQAQPELLAIARGLLPSSWLVARQGPWFHAIPPDADVPHQGWKIHLSATVSSSADVLRVAVQVCADSRRPFKFACDRAMLAIMSGKDWPRGAGGKFVTIYPADEAQFLSLAELLTRSLQGRTGPYILSDRRYRDSSCVYYRYGGLRAHHEVLPSGERQSVIVSPDGETVVDARLPYWSPPAWARDPVAQTGASDDLGGGSLTLKQGRYVVEEALHFSNVGGVYRALDVETGSHVVVKEARPHAGESTVSGSDAVKLLRKEHRILTRLRDTGIAPRPIDLFVEWEHLFLVEEFVDGAMLDLFSISTNPLAHDSPDLERVRGHYERWRRLWTALIRAVARIHEHGIVCGDLSTRNVMLADPEAASGLRIIDFEAAWEEDVDSPTMLGTPGFVRSGRGPGAQRSRADDWYAVGAVVQATLFPIVSLLELHPGARDSFLDALTEDLGLPATPGHVIRYLMDGGDPTPVDPELAVRAIECSPLPVKPPAWGVPHSSDELLATVAGVTRHIIGSADPGREDRLFPADPTVFQTNPLSVAWGATGVAYALWRLNGELPPWLHTWLLSRSVTAADYPPGLYVGLSGIAWALWEIGHHDLAMRTLDCAHHHPLLGRSPNLFEGAAGYGLACLHLHQRTGEGRLLEHAIEVGERLLATGVEDGRGVSWPTEGEPHQVGYAWGASGIAMFLLSLHLQTGSRTHLDTGLRALRFDLAQARLIEGDRIGLPRFVDDDDPKQTVSPYWVFGTAGVVSVLLRYWAVTRDDELRRSLDALLPHLTRKYTVFPGLFLGLAGCGDVLLDVYQFTGEARFLDAAHRVASGIMLFRVPRHAGMAFPGEQLARISTDLGTGSAGIALFLHRLATATAGTPTFNFTVDAVRPAVAHPAHG